MTSPAHQDDPDECDYCGELRLTRIYGDFAICSSCRREELGLMLVRGGNTRPKELEAKCPSCDTFVPVTWLQEVDTCGGGKICDECADREHAEAEAAESDYGPGAMDEQEGWK